MTSRDIAIIGMAGRFPGADSVAELWTNLQAGRDSIARLTASQLRAAGVPEYIAIAPSYVPAAAMLSDVESFDASYFELTEREAAITDPQQRLFLEVAAEALEVAGYGKRRRRRVGVWAGASINTYMFRLWDHGAIDTTTTLPLVIGNDKDYLSTRVSYKLKLTGPSVAVQSACSTSLVAVAMACDSLVAGDCELALAGGVSVKVPHGVGYLHEPGGILSADGHCRVFDATATGTVFGSGVGVIVLKPLADALRDGDWVHAVVKGWAVNNDGGRKRNFGAPSIDGQTEVILAALRMAGVTPDALDYVEAHATGTTVGDTMELAALKRVFRVRGRGLPPCRVGSIKGNVGHLETAAGVVGTIKTALMLEHGQLVPTAHFQQPAIALDPSEDGFDIQRELAPWPTRNGIRLAGVSAFGVGGTNAHIVLAGPPDRERQRSHQRWHVLPVSAQTAAAVADLSAQLATRLEHDPSLDMADVAYTLQVGRAELAHRRIVVCTDPRNAAAALRRTREHWSPTGTDRPVAFICTGRGAPLHCELYAGDPAFRVAVDTCLRHLEPRIAHRLWTSPAPGSDPDVAGPAAFVFGYALAQMWLRFGVRPHAVLGCGVGEVLAACLAGAFKLADALTIVAADDTARLAEILRHTPLGQPAIPLASSATGTWMTPAEAADPRHWTRRPHPTRYFAGAMDTLLSDSRRVMVEIGPADELASGTAMQSEREVPIVASLPGDVSSPQQARFYEALGRLWAIGASVDLGAAYAGETRRRVPLPTYPFQRRRFWIDAATTTPDGRIPPHCGENVHPLLGHARPADGPVVQFDRIVTASDPAFLDEHRLAGSAVFPFAAYVEMAIAAAIDGKLPFPFTLHEVTVDEALLVPAERPVRLHTVLDGLGSREMRLGLYASTSASEPRCWIRHAHCRLARGTVEPTYDASVALSDVLRRCVDEHGAEELYAALAARGLELGPTFKRLTWVRRRPGEAIARLDSSPIEVSDAVGFHVHPGLLDACLQVTAAALASEVPQELAVPVTCRAVVVARPAGIPAWTHAILRGDGEDSTFEIRVLDEAEQLLLRWEELRLTPLRRRSPPQRSQVDTTSPATVTYDAYWCATRPTVAPAAGAAVGQWLVLADRGGLGERLAQAIDRAGGLAVVLSEHLEARDGRTDPDSTSSDEETAAWLRDELPTPTGSWRGIVHLGGLDTVREGSVAEDVVGAQLRTGMATARLVRVLAGMAGAHRPALWIVTRGAQPVDASVSQPTHATLWGMSRVIALEHPEVACHSVDLDPAASTDDVETLLGELVRPDPQSYLGIRRGLCFEPRLIERQADADGSPRPYGRVPIRNDGTYLITGGLGGVGMELCRWLIRRGARSLVVAGRSEPVLLARRSLDALRRPGVHIVPARVDVADIAQVRALLERIDRELPPLVGVIHAAAVLDDGILLRQDADRLATVLRPKVAGAWNLHQLTHDRSLDLFVLCSSLAAVIGSPGQFSYAAANAFVDALAHYRRRQGLPAVAIAWGPWKDVGLATGRGSDHWTRVGIAPLEPDAAIAALEDALDRGHTTTIATARDQAPTVSIARANSTSTTTIRPSAVDVPHRDGLLPAVDITSVALTLRTHIAAMLRVPETNVDLEHPLDALGLDSLMALELRNWILQRFDADLPMASLLEATTVKDVAHHIVAEASRRALGSQTDVPRSRPRTQATLTDLLQTIERLSNDEVDRLLHDDEPID